MLILKLRYIEYYYDQCFKKRASGAPWGSKSARRCCNWVSLDGLGAEAQKMQNKAWKAQKAHIRRERRAPSKRGSFWVFENKARFVSFGHFEPPSPGPQTQPPPSLSLSRFSSFPLPLPIPICLLPLPICFLPSPYPDLPPSLSLSRFASFSPSTMRTHLGLAGLGFSFRSPLNLRYAHLGSSFVILKLVNFWFARLDWSFIPIQLEPSWLFNLSEIKAVCFLNCTRVYMLFYNIW